MKTGTLTRIKSRPLMAVLASMVALLIALAFVMIKLGYIRGPVLVHGDGSSVGAEVYFGEEKVGTMKEKTLDDGTISSSVEVSAKWGTDMLKIVSVDGRILEKRIRLDEIGYVDISFKDMMIVAY